MFITFWIIFMFFASAYSDETYENSTKICEKCVCYVDGSEYYLDCRERHLEHSLANWPDHNTTLIATFSYNEIGTLEELPFSDFVLELVFDHCGIKSLDNGVFKNVRKVEYIDLSYNLLTTEEIAPEKFKGPYNNTVYEPIGIKNLNLAYNKIHSLPHNIFEHIAATLKELNLEGNKFKILDHQTQLCLSSLTNLRRLNLANNDLTELVEDSISKLGKLVAINLSFNMLDFVPETLTFIGDHLEILNLDNNLIFELTNESFLGMKGIKELSLNGLSRLEYVNANVFTPLPNLKVLSMANNVHLKMIDREAFAPKPTIEELYLNNNSLHELDSKLLKWSTLQTLKIEDNEFYCDCDLYNISRSLKGEITRTRDGPVCIDPVTDSSRQIYRLDDDVCKLKETAYGLRQISDNFETIRIVLLTMTTIFTFTATVAVIIAYLRYRRHRMNQNYPFATQVLYNPINSQPFVS